MKVKAASQSQRRHWVREWNRMSSVSSGFRRTTRLESCPTTGTDAADRPCYSDGVQRSPTGGVDMPKKAPNEANLKLKQSSESQAIKSRNGGAEERKRSQLETEWDGQKWQLDNGCPPGAAGRVAREPESAVSEYEEMVLAVIQK